MPIRDLITVHNPTLGVYRHALSTSFELFDRDALLSIDRGYGHCWRAMLGALYDSDGDLIPFSRRDGGRPNDLVVDLDPPRILARDSIRIEKVLAGRTLYLGHFMMAYGHFLVETMSRFWSVALGAYDHFVFFPFNTQKAPTTFLDYQKIILSKFNIPADRITILQGPTEFEEIHVPEALCTINHRANIHMSKIYRRIANFYPQEGGGSRIFLSRLQPFARLANVVEVEAIFRDFDFQVVYPETMDLHTQIELYANCRVMGGLAGSALHNCLFCREGSALIELGDTRSRTQPLRTQKIVNQAAGVEAFFIAYEGTAGGEMDTAQLRRTLSTLPLLGRSIPPHQKDSAFRKRNMADHYPWPAALTAHVANIGDVAKAGELEIGGTGEGPAAIEGFSILLDRNAPFGLEYKALLHGGTWTAWSPPGTFVGSRGKAKAIYGYAVRLDATASGRFSCVCFGTFAGHDGIVEAFDGNSCAAANGGRLMGLQIQLRRA